MDEKQIAELIEQLKSAAARHLGEDGNPVAIKTGGGEWLKLFSIILIQTVGIVYWGTRLIDNHDARITAVEKSTAEQGETIKKITAMSDIVTRLDERTKNFQTAIESRLDRIDQKQK